VTGKNDEYYGKGTEKTPLGTYDGDWKFGKMEGKGKFTFANGNYYEGEWKNNLQNGKGTLTFLSGDRYQGEFKDGKMSGNGIMFFTNGEQYQGEWFDDKMHGVGVYTSPPPKSEKNEKLPPIVFEGEFLNGFRMVEGVKMNANGTKLPEEEIKRDSSSSQNPIFKAIEDMKKKNVRTTSKDQS